MSGKLLSWTFNPKQTNQQKQKQNKQKANPLPLRITILINGKHIVRLHRQCERGMIRTKTVCLCITQT